MLHRGGNKAGTGTYWDVTTGRRIDVAQECILEGDRNTLYVKAPTAAVIAAGPALGLLFAVFLPFIGIAMTLMLIVRKLAQGVATLAAGSMSFGWRPSEAYLGGNKKKAGRSVREKNTPGAR